MAQDISTLLPLKKSDLPLTQSGVDLKQNELADSSTTNSDSAWTTFDTTFLEPAKRAFDKDKQEITQKRNKKPSAPQAGEPKVSSVSISVQFSNEDLSSVDDLIQKIFNQYSKVKSKFENLSEDVTVTPPANEDATNTYTKFYEVLNSKTSGEYSATLKLPLEFSEYPNYVQTNFGEFNTDKDTASRRIANVISTLDESSSTNTIETLKSISVSSLNLFFALLFFRCMKGQIVTKKGYKNMDEKGDKNMDEKGDKNMDELKKGGKNMDEFKLERALTDLSLNKIDDIIRALRGTNADYSFVDIIDKLNEREQASLSSSDQLGGSSSTSKKNRKSHKSYHPDIGKTRKHHHSRHKKVSFVH